jgi:acyl-CoA hydrolase
LVKLKLMTNASPKWLSPDDAIRLIGSDQNVVVSHASAEPPHFFRLIGERAREIHGTRIFCANPGRSWSCFSDPGLASHVVFEVFFLSQAVRQSLGFGHVHHVPAHMSRWARHILNGKRRIHVYWGTCSPPGPDGHVSLGLNACYEPEVLARADLVILEVNPRMPRTYGATRVPLDRVHYFIEQPEAPPTHASPAPGAEELLIGGHVAELVPDGATLQLGIGAIPNAIGKSLAVKRNLGVHTEMVNDAIVDLYRAGAIDGSMKTLWPGKIIGVFVYGSRALYDFVDNNPEVELHPASIVNDVVTIGRNSKMTSINTAVEVDLTGQVCSESVGHYEISGVGGASDTHAGARRSEGGRGIIALRSMTRDGLHSKIVHTLAPGAKVSISRNDIDTVVTEFGVAELAGKNVADRVRAMIAIAHPAVREELMSEARRLAYL